ncbi:MAG TPA: glycosyltransferase family 9 protein, partial [Bacillota bacterium]|nr:glycosyltransferase family 9 protein [Bacillota bacterium]
MSYRNILLVKLSAIGDVIHALPVAHALKEAFPQARLTWIVEKPAYELVAGHPFIDEVILFEKARLRSLAGLKSYLPELMRNLKLKHFDLALDLQGLLKSGMIAWLSGASQRLVYCNTREFSDWISRKVCGPHQGGHIIEQYLDVVRALGGPVSTVDFGIRFSAVESEAAQGILAGSGWRGEPYVV